MSHNHGNSTQENETVSLKQTFLKGLFKENGLLVMVLGMCPSLAVTSSFEGALGMGILVMIVLTATNSTISLIRHLIPNTIRIPVFVLVIATEVTVMQMLVNAFAYDLSVTLGVFISLITVNCIVFGRAEAYASKNKVLNSALDGLGCAIGYGIALIGVGFIREVFGTFSLTFGAKLPLGIDPITIQFLPKEYALSFLINPPGAFLVLGLILAVISAISNHKKQKKIDSKVLEALKKKQELAGGIK
ncbi:MAG: electron transport complex subunit E [Acholeplasmatales bacterium]|jgi:RnfABCDGE-type electron transport complex E subunit|nr:electron transport complex subunit E [Acholeplasmatales bacterium]